MYEPKMMIIIRCFGRMRNDRKDLSTCRKIYSSATLSITHPTQATFGWHSDPCGEKPVMNCLTHRKGKEADRFSDQPKSQTYAFKHVPPQTEETALSYDYSYA
jgi:hypothetical protein